jgi:hypothetical protein
MLGVRRAGVTEALHHLEADATITVMRGEIVVRDRSKLEGAANGCYGLPEGEYGRLIGPAPITKQ